MEIFFCDLCNESVPEADLTSGQAYHRSGRIVCAACDSAMGGGSEAGKPAEGGSLGAAPAVALAGAAAAEAPGAAAWSRPAKAPQAPALPVQATPGPAGLWLGLLVLVFSASGMWILFQRMETFQADQREKLQSLQLDAQTTRRTHDIFAAGLGQQLGNSEERTAAASAEARRPLAEGISALRSDLSLSLEREGQVGSQLRALGEQLKALENTQRDNKSQTSDSLGDLHRDIEFYKERLLALEETVRQVSARGPVLALGGDQPQTAAAWSSSLPDLKHSNAGLRLDAIYALGETKDKAVIPHLIPMLEDDDLFVRMATARMLEDLQARSAVPALIKALEDEQSAVREAAMGSLRRITGKNFRFDPVASDADRSGKIKAWRSWWQKNGDEFLLGG